MTDIISYDKAGSAILAQLSNILDRIRDTNSLADMTKARSYVESLRYAAQEARVTLDIQNEVAETKLRIERRLGESIASIDRQQGRRSDLETLSQPATKLFQEVLDEAGINKDNAARWQKIAALPEDKFEHYIAATKDERAELTTAHGDWSEFEVGEGDPSYAAILGAYTGAMNDYVRHDLRFESDLPYEVLTGLYERWDYSKHQNKYVDVSETLRAAISQNPFLKVIIANGFYDLATPYFATEYTVNHLALAPDLRANLTLAYYEAGHMMYVHEPSLAQLRADLVAFLHESRHGEA